MTAPEDVVAFNSHCPLRRKLPNHIPSDPERLRRLGLGWCTDFSCQAWTPKNGHAANREASSQRMKGVELQIQFQNMDTRFT